MPSLSLVLPITENDIADLLGSEDPRGVLSRAPAPRVASVIVLQQIPALSAKMERIDRILARALSELLQGTQRPLDLKYLREAAIKGFDAGALKRALSMLEGQGISLSHEADFRIAQPTRPNGSLNPNFSVDIIARRSPSSYSTLDHSVKRLGLNDPQGRTVNRIIAEPDEHLHVHGYPGSGKSHLIQTLTTALPAKKTLILAMTKSQLDALFQRVASDEVKGDTFSSLAASIIDEMLMPGQWNPGRRAYQSYNVTNQQIAEHLSLGWVGTMKPALVADVCRRTVMSYCYTSHTEIGEHHIPKTGARLSAVDKAALVQYSWHFWEQTILPEKGTDFLPLRGYHAIKYVALKHWSIPDIYAHVIIDEAHDLTSPMMQILDRSPGRVITMGDKFQRLEGRAPSRSYAVRRSDLDLTMRAGREMESVLNPLIEGHPLASGESPLRATDNVKTVCDYYDRPSIPDAPCTILVGGQWQLFEYFQRLSHEGVKFTLLPGSYAQFQSFAEGLIDLFHDGVRAKNSFLFRYPDWESLQNASQNIKAFQRIESMLRKGYTRTQLDASLMNIVPLAKAKYLLGRVDDARNLEFQSVMLTPELIPRGSTLRNDHFLASAVSRLYVGASRAKNRIILPGYMMDWLKDQKS